jgi:Zn-dependent protease
MFTIEPDVPLAVGLVIAAIAVCSGAIAGALLLSVPTSDRGRHKRAVAPSLRRAIEVTAIVGLVLLLRVVDGLTVITGGFIVLGFLVAEVILSARPGRASR